MRLLTGQQPAAFRPHPSAFILVLALPCLLVLGPSCGHHAWKWSHELDFPLPPGLVLSAVVDGDTLQPYEPICATVSITNVSDKPAPIPKLLYWSPSRVYDLSLVSAQSEKLPAGFGPVSMSYFERPKPSYDTLLPGEVLSDTHRLAEFVGVRDSLAGGFYRLPPGEYQLRATWDHRVFPEDWPGDVDTAACAPFVVRRPSAQDEEAMRLYGSLMFFNWDIYWSRPEFSDPATPGGRRADSWFRVDSCATEILRHHSDAEPYAPLALEQLVRTMHSRLLYLRGAHPDSVPVWSDSVETLWLELMDRFPNSRTAAHVLRGYRFVEVWKGKHAHAAALRRLNDRHPGTRVDAEVKRQLALIVEQRD